MSFLIDISGIDAESEGGEDILSLTPEDDSASLDSMVIEGGTQAHERVRTSAHEEATMENINFEPKICRRSKCKTKRRHKLS